MKKEKERKEDNNFGFHVGRGVERNEIESKDQLGAN